MQNDFSFYRRELGKNQKSTNLPVDDTEASTISMFVAQSYPLLYALVTAIHESDMKLSHVLLFLADFSNACYNNLKGETNCAILQTLSLAMISSVTLYDQLSSEGVFTKNSPMDVKKVILAARDLEEKKVRSQAFSTLRYEVKSFSRAPVSIRRLLQ